MEQDQGTSFLLYFSVLAVNLASFTSGTAFGWPSPSIPKLNGYIDPDMNPLNEPITPSEESLLASLIGLGGMISPFIAGFLTDRIGRKFTLALFAIPISISFIIIAFASNVWFFYVARLLAGFSIGGFFVVIPNYVAENSQAHNRGKLSCMMLLMITLGFQSIYCVGPYVSIQMASLLCLVPPTLLLLSILTFLPESVFYLLKKNRESEAYDVWCRLRNKHSSEMREEILKISKSIESSSSSSNLCNVFSHKGAFITLGLLSFQQFSGINVVLFYMQTIFDSTNSSLPPEISTIIVGAVQFFAALVTPFVVDSLGRKCLLYISGFGSALSLTAMGAFFFIKEADLSTESILWLPIASLVVFIITYNVGFGALPFTLMSEVLPPAMKAVASSALVVYVFFLTAAITKMFPDVSAALGLAASFWVLAAFCVVSIGFTYFIVPETKGKSLSEIQDMLERRRKG